jgi:hypothetical protein
MQPLPWLLFLEILVSAAIIPVIPLPRNEKLATPYLLTQSRHVNEVQE